MPSGNWNGRKRNCFVRPISSEASIDWGLPTCPRWNPSGNASGGWIVPSGSNEHILKTLRIATIVPLVYILIVACQQKLATSTFPPKSTKFSRKIGSNFDILPQGLSQPENDPRDHHAIWASSPGSGWGARRFQASTVHHSSPSPPRPRVQTPQLDGP